jgi:hypothetical protein
MKYKTAAEYDEAILVCKAKLTLCHYFNSESHSQSEIPYGHESNCQWLQRYGHLKCIMHEQL